MTALILVSNRPLKTKTQGGDTRAQYAKRTELSCVTSKQGQKKGMVSDDVT